MPKKAVKQIAQNDESKLDLKLRVFQMQNIDSYGEFLINRSTFNSFNASKKWFVHPLIWKWVMQEEFYV